MWKLQPPWKKSTLSFLTTPFSKLRSCQAPTLLFQNWVRGSTSLQQQGECTLCKHSLHVAWLKTSLFWCPYNWEKETELGYCLFSNDLVENMSAFSVSFSMFQLVILVCLNNTNLKLFTSRLINSHSTSLLEMTIFFWQRLWKWQLVINFF